jgi:SAM-dependent methyltransferase
MRRSAGPAVRWTIVRPGDGRTGHPPGCYDSGVGDDDRSRRAVFDGVAERYDAERPGYPDAIVDAALAGVPARARILEIGCGTGKASVAFARRGHRVLGVELGANLAAVARRNLAALDFATWVGPFEEWPVEEAAFDLVVSAQALHWVDPEIGFPKIRRALRPGGALAVIYNLHPGTEPGFIADVDAVYDAHVPELCDADTRIPLDERIARRRRSIEASGLFGPVAVTCLRWVDRLPTARYLALLDTYSDHITLAPDRRARLHAALGELIDLRYGGIAERAYVATLFRAMVHPDSV